MSHPSGGAQAGPRSWWTARYPRCDVRENPLASAEIGGGSRIRGVPAWPISRLTRSKHSPARRRCRVRHHDRREREARAADGHRRGKDSDVWQRRRQQRRRPTAGHQRSYNGSDTAKTKALTTAPARSDTLRQRRRQRLDNAPKTARQRSDKGSTRGGNGSDNGGGNGGGKATTRRRQRRGTRRKGSKTAAATRRQRRLVRRRQCGEDVACGDGGTTARRWRRT